MGNPTNRMPISSKPQNSLILTSNIFFSIKIGCNPKSLFTNYDERFADSARGGRTAARNRARADRLPAGGTIIFDSIIYSEEKGGARTRMVEKKETAGKKLDWSRSILLETGGSSSGMPLVDGAMSLPSLRPSLAGRIAQLKRTEPRSRFSIDEPERSSENWERRRPPAANERETGAKQRAASRTRITTREIPPLVQPSLCFEFLFKCPYSPRSFRPARMKNRVVHVFRSGSSSHHYRIPGTRKKSTFYGLTPG